MELTSYLTAKEKKLVTLKRYGSDFALEKRQFDRNTGEELMPETQAFKREEIVIQIKRCKNTLIELEAFLADIDALK